ncbi:MAG: TonB family protein [Opitutus sp.]
MRLFLPRRILITLALLTFGLIQLSGQEITITPLTWTDPEDAPDTLPVFARSLRAEFPEQLKKMAEVGWAEVHMVVSNDGKLLTWRVDASQPALGKAVEAMMGNHGKMKPARRDTVAVNSMVGFSVIFNPASANSRQNNSTPRLVMAICAVDPRLKNSAAGSRSGPQVVWAEAEVDATGRLIPRLEGLDESVRCFLASAAEEWRYVPAQRDGAPVAAVVRVPFVVVAPLEVPGKNEVTPRWTKRVPPEYPLAMRRSGLRGEVLIEFTVDIEGRVRDAVVIRALNPGFNEAALAAVRRWRFDPARVEGIPVLARMQQPITFSLDTFEGGDDGTEIIHRANQSKLPEKLRYDVAPQPKALEVPQYPYDLLRAGVKGKAQVSLLIAPNGRVALSKVISAKSPEFGYALQAAAERFEYTPALRASQPTQSLMGFQQDFDRWDHALVSDVDRNLLRMEERHPEQVLKHSSLDEALHPTFRRAPIYPSALAESSEAGEAVIEFLVVEDGTVHLPRIIRSTKPEFGYAAAQAVSSWRFTPPRSKGKPGIVRVRVPMAFESEAQPPVAPDK